MRRNNSTGFTLIELSIVLVIIGLIVGGVLTGRDLISAAEVRAQVTQIEKYNSAVNTFRGKFGGIPGDLQLATAQQFGFNSAGCNGITQSQRNGDGLIDAYAGGPILGFGNESALFWEDLSAANLIEGQFPNSGGAAFTCILTPALVLTALSQDMPVAKIGNGNFVYVYDASGSNWFAISAVTGVAIDRHISSGTTMSVIQAYRVDTKIDDGLPTTGNVLTAYINNNQSVPATPPNTTTAGGTASSCYDTTTGTYSITVNNGSGGNCAISIRMQ